MKREKIRKNGFTLIELLAVIIILGILMIIAIPSVTSYINNSRKSSYVTTIKEIASGVRNMVNEGKLEMFDTATTYYIPTKCVKTENSQSSPYGDFDKAYIVVLYTGKKYNYFWTGVDKTGQGTKGIVSIDQLDEDDITPDIKASDIHNDYAVNFRKNYQIMDDSTCIYGDKTSTSKEINGYSGLMPSVSFDITFDKYYVDVGDIAHFTAKIKGFENVNYKIQWQISVDGVNYEPYPTELGGNDEKFDVVITEENFDILWRVTVSYLSDKD